jgi:hypothetical protein
MEAIAVQLRMTHLFEDPLTKLSVPIAAGTPASAGALARPVARLCGVCGGPLGDVDPLMNQQVHVSGPCNTNSYCLRCWADVFRDVGESLWALVRAWFAVSVFPSPAPGGFLKCCPGGKQGSCILKGSSFGPLKAILQTAGLLSEVCRLSC